MFVVCQHENRLKAQMLICMHVVRLIASKQLNFIQKIFNRIVGRLFLFYIKQAGNHPIILDVMSMRSLIEDVPHFMAIEFLIPNEYNANQWINLFHSRTDIEGKHNRKT